MKLWLLLAMALLVGCAGNQAKPDLDAFYAHKPRSILVVPVVNESPEITASPVFSSTISAPLAERGYYVFPLYLTELILRDFGLSEAGHVHMLPTQRFYDLFGADAVLFVTIKDWSSKYLVLASTVVVSMEYLLKDTKTGTVLWQKTETVAKSSNSGAAGGGLAGVLVTMAVSAAMNAALTDYLPLARQANQQVFQPRWGLPAGPYNPLYGKDQDKF